MQENSQPEKELLGESGGIYLNMRVDDDLKSTRVHPFVLPADKPNYNAYIDSFSNLQDTLPVKFFKFDPERRLTDHPTSFIEPVGDYRELLRNAQKDYSSYPYSQSPVGYRDNKDDILNILSAWKKSR